MSISVAQQKKVMTQIAKIVSEEFSGKDFETEELISLLMDTKIKWPKFKAKKDPTKPKQGLSAYIIYTSEIREQTKKDNPSLLMTDLSKVMGAKWKDLSTEEKAQYVAKSEVDKARAKEEISAWESSKSDSSSESDDGSGVEPKTKSKTKSKPKDKPKDGAPKKAKNSWQFYQQVKKAENSDVDQKDIRASWKVLEDKTEFEQMATTDKERYASELEAFEANN
jgi:hypothetical protein